MSANAAPRAIADVTAGTVLATVDIMVPPQRVFDALSDPAEITRWWGSAQAYTTESWVTDFRVGGKWRAGGRGADGAEFSVGGEFIEIDAPWRIVQSWEPAWAPGLRTIVHYQLTPIDGGTRLVVRHEGFGEAREACQSHGDGWAMVLGWLSAHLAPQPAEAATLFFLARLLPPRPHFMMDMNDDERAMMMAHGVYWKGQQDAGKMLVYGPVADPKGGWGVGILKVGSIDELHALQAQDPAILANRGLSYENLPMLRAVYRDV